MEMTKKVLRDICKQHDLYRTPHLNDTLYANFQAFTSVANLEEYTGLKALFLEGNALVSLEGLPHLPLLKCLCAPIAILACFSDCSIAMTSVGLLHYGPDDEVLVSLSRGTWAAPHLWRTSETGVFVPLRAAVRHVT